MYFVSRLTHAFNFVIQINKDFLNNISRVVFLTWKLYLFKNISERIRSLFELDACWRRILWLVKGASMNFNGRTHINLLKPTGHVMHQQFNIQQLYVLPTLYLCVLYLSENKQRLVPLTA